MFVLLACAPGPAPCADGTRNEHGVCVADAAELRGTACLYGARDLMGLDWTLILADDGGAELSIGGSGHAPAMSSWFNLDAPASVCGVDDLGRLSPARNIPWTEDSAPTTVRFAACLADATINGIPGTLVLADDGSGGLIGYGMAVGGYVPEVVALRGESVVIGEVALAVESAGAIDDCTLTLAGDGVDVSAYEGWKYGQEEPTASLVVEAPSGSAHVFDLGG
jgi:hypothetical protein